ncbi:hypothetical protein KQH82_02440 [bacterium]|nr:hypothetical protein [bacterium]
MENNKDKIRQLLAYHRGTLAADERRVVDSALQSDSELRDLLALVVELDQAVGTRDDILGDPARKLSTLIIRDFLGRKADPDSRRGVVVFDSSVVPLPDGVRPAAVDTRELRYKLDEAELSLALYPLTMNSYEMVGQISGRPSEEALSVVVKQGRKTQSVAADRHHLFRFARVSGGDCRLSVVRGGDEIAFITIDI